MRTAVKWIILGIALFLLPLLTGCSREYRETRRNIDRIYKAAEQSAEKRAVAYILEKYGIQAVPQGHWVQADYDFFTSYTNPNVIVFMDDGNRKFCVGVHAFDKTVLWDNYQREAIEAVLWDHLEELYNLPQPDEMEIVFRLSRAPYYKAVMPQEWRDRGYDHHNMADFYFDGHSIEELLPQLDLLEYTLSWLSLDRSLESLVFKPEDWRVAEGCCVEWILRWYSSPEGRFTAIGTDHPDIAGYPYLRQWRHTLFKAGNSSGQKLFTDFMEFHSARHEGISFVTTLPCEMEDILLISEREGGEDWTIDSKNNGPQTYKLISNLYEITEKASDSHYIAAMAVPSGLTEQHECPLYILSRNRETGAIKVEARISTWEELSSIPDTDQRKNYKMYANGIQGMSAGCQYVLAKRTEEGQDRKT